MSRFAFLAQKLYNCPLAITPEKGEMVAAALAERLGVSRFRRSSGETVPLAPAAWMDDDEDVSSARARRKEDQGYDVVSGVAVIPVRGTLVQRLGSVRPYCGMTGYDGIRLSVMCALSDEKVDAIVLDIDSPGGEVCGCFDLVDTIYNARGIKPIWSILNESAFSAAYAIASAADVVTVPRTGGTGSVGVILMHTDISKALSKEGVTVTLITYGDRKGEGSSYAPLADEALSRLQADVDAMGDLFVQTVARNRGIPAKQVRDTEAGTFLGSAGVAGQYADRVMSPDQAFRALLASLPSKRKN